MWTAAYHLHLTVKRAPACMKGVDGDSEVTAFVLKLHEGGGEGQESLENFNAPVFLVH